MALVGEAFGQHPEVFRRIHSSSSSAEQEEAFRMLSELGDRVFEYYPDREPMDFDTAYQAATWLDKKKQNKAEMATPRKPSD